MIKISVRLVRYSMFGLAAADLAKERRALQEEIDSLQSVASIPSLPDLRETLDLAQSISTCSKDQHRRLLKQLAAAIELECRERILRIKWAPGGESAYRVPRFGGGPGRSVEESMETARERLGSFGYSRSRLLVRRVINTKNPRPNKFHYPVCMAFRPIYLQNAIAEHHLFNEY